jgi:hypothetical protein
MQWRTRWRTTALPLTLSVLGLLFLIEPGQGGSLTIQNGRKSRSAEVQPHSVFRNFDIADELEKDEEPKLRQKREVTAPSTAGTDHKVKNYTVRTF